MQDGRLGSRNGNADHRDDSVGPLPCCFSRASRAGGCLGPPLACNSHHGHGKLTGLHFRDGAIEPREASKPQSGFSSPDLF